MGQDGLNNEFSYLTAIRRTAMSAPARWLLRAGLLKGRVLDFGCGYGRDVVELGEKGVCIVGYDPHFAPQFPDGKYDTIICIYVLNVLLPHQQPDVLMNVAELLAPGGHCYYAVRRDLTTEGFRLHAVHRQMTYQKMVRLPYPSLHLNSSFEIYDYTPTVLPAGRTLITETCAALAYRNDATGEISVCPRRDVPPEELTQRELTAIEIVRERVAGR